MSIWSGETAAQILEESGFRCHYRGTKSANFSVPGPQRREISIALERKNVVTAYVNRRSVIEQLFPADGIDGVDLVELYPHGHVGKNGNPGIAGSVARHNPSLNPRTNEVLRLHLRDEISLRRLLSWYAPGNFP